MTPSCCRASIEARRRPSPLAFCLASVGHAVVRDLERERALGPQHLDCDLRGFGMLRGVSQSFREDRLRERLEAARYPHGALPADADASVLFLEPAENPPEGQLGLPF